MLTLQRLVGETIVIGDNIKVTIVDVKGGKVRLGFEAPKDVTIHRQEIWEKIQQQKRGEIKSSAIRAAKASVRLDIEENENWEKEQNKP